MEADHQGLHHNHLPPQAHRGSPSIITLVWRTSQVYSDPWCTVTTVKSKNTILANTRISMVLVTADIEEFADYVVLIMCHFRGLSLYCFALCYRNWSPVKSPTSGSQTGPTMACLQVPDR